MSEVSSNILLLKNINKTSGYNVHIRYSNNSEGQGDLSISPLAYIGIYIGPEAIAPSDPALYKWAKYSGESSYVDIRYATTVVKDNGEIEYQLTFSDDENHTPNGKNPSGDVIGFLVTTNDIVLDPEWYPKEDADASGISIECYTWSSFSENGQDAIFYELVFYKAERTVVEQEIQYIRGASVVNFYKTITTEKSYNYTPDLFFPVLYENKGTERREVNNVNIKYIICYSDSSDTGEKENNDKEQPINISEESKKHITQIIFNCYEGTAQSQPTDQSQPIDTQEEESSVAKVSPFFTQIKEVTFSVEESIAKLTLNADNITAALDSTKVIFDKTGLTIQKGGFLIKNEDDKDVLYFDTKTKSLVVEGEIKAGSGAIGAWKIDEYGLSNNPVGSDAPRIGIYGANVDVASYEGETICLWAAENEEKRKNNNYDFFVTSHGTLYANRALIEGKITANDGLIRNKFFIGENTENNIVIYGNDSSSEENSYIGTGLFTSGMLGNGWKISSNGTAEFSNIIARGKIQSSVFEHSKISSIGGSLYIAPTIYVDSESTNIERIYANAEDSEPQSIKVTWDVTSLVKKYNTDNNIITIEIGNYIWKIGYEVKIDGEILYYNNGPKKASISNINAIITDIQKNNDKRIILTIDLNDSNIVTQINEYFPKQVASTAILAEEAGEVEGEEGVEDEEEIVDQIITDPYFSSGTIIVIYGTGNNKRQGIYLTAAEENSPYLEVYDSGDGSLSIPAVRLGNLSGISDSNFSTLTGYGLYSSNAYLRGQLVLPKAGITNQDSIGYNVITNQYYEIDSEDKANAIRIWAGGDYPSISNPYPVAPFIVTQDGSLYASKGVFQGIVKATNSEFSGTIKAAGIVIDNANTPDKQEADHNHFFVAYKDSPDNFNDYVLDIDSSGLSIWEGGLRAYSDEAGKENNGKIYSKIYGYLGSDQMPEPFFYLVDELTNRNNGSELNSRLVAYKGHFLQIKEILNNNNDITEISTNSIILDDGIIFKQNTSNFEEKKRNLIESNAFTEEPSKIGSLKLQEYSFKEEAKTFLSLSSSGSIDLSTEYNSSVYIVSKDDNFLGKENGAKLYVGGSIKLGGDNENSIYLQDQIIKEVKVGGNTIGIDIIVNKKVQS